MPYHLINIFIAVNSFCQVGHAPGTTFLSTYYLPQILGAVYCSEQFIGYPLSEFEIHLR